ncbi:TOMM precursor leader peptide-binding protein [Solidesulfovibrio sp.]|uniref:TOMM precursor leader peptide-binding protein n=1 Tax=Solidesulfovibrio sp. TaxID=2910990 RepID=UPI00260A9462|nr:TOMM precursor leader peptide-binding protein [Solidesulfovibrio sp.]
MKESSETSARPRLHPWLLPLPAAAETPDGGEARVLLAETAPLRLVGPLFVALLGLLDGSRTEEEIVDALSGRFAPAEVHYGLLRLRQQRLLGANGRDVRCEADVLTVRLGGDPQSLSRRPRLEVAAVGGLAPGALAEALANGGAFSVDVAGSSTAPPSPGAIRIVVTPGYLEPELAVVDRLAFEAGWSWLPVKPCGIEPWMGPLFSPGRTACLECLLHRLRGHRPQEARLARENGRPPRLARGVAPYSLAALAGLLGLELAKAVSGSPGAFLGKGVVSLNLETLALTRHELIRRPHCPACGQGGPVALAGVPQAPLVLSSRPKSGHTDGGERIKGARETLAGLEPRLSPITGEVGELAASRDIPECFGHAVTATWATVRDVGGDWTEGRSMAVGIASGKGRSESQARASALGEALERYCAQHFGHEPRLTAAYDAVRSQAVHPGLLNPFSPSQYADREGWARRGRTGFVPEPFDEAAPIDWTPAWSLTRRAWRLVPSACVYYAYPEAAGGRFCRGDSNGVAAGNCLEEAVMQGFYELAERDAVAVWWYNRLRLPALDLDGCGSALVREAAAGLARRGYRLHVLDLTNDLAVPVLAAVALHEADPEAEPLLGFGAHAGVGIALDRAVAELGQCLAFVKRVGVNAPHRRVTGENLSAMAFLRPRPQAAPRPVAAFASRTSDDFLTDIEEATAMLRGLGLEMLVVDLSRPEVGLRVARVMVPGLVHFWPRLGAARLAEVPVKLGWLPAPLPEEAMNPVPFFF